jgi:hypothetical protein
MGRSPLALLFSICSHNSERESSANCVVAQLRFQAVEPPGKIGPVRHYQGDMSNPLRPDLMTPAERLDEIGDILATGLMRLRARKSSPLSRDHGESSLDFSPDQRGHASAHSLSGDA